jgi:hypothetical protein
MEKFRDFLAAHSMRIKLLLMALSAIGAFCVTPAGTPLSYAHPFAALVMTFSLIVLNGSEYGHGVEKRLHILRMRPWHFFVYVAITSIAVYICLITDTKVSVSSIARLHATGLTAVFAVAAAFIDWQLLAYDETFYLSEDIFRQKYAELGFHEEDVELLINDQRNKGSLPQKPRKKPQLWLVKG